MNAEIGGSSSFGISNEKAPEKEVMKKENHRKESKEKWKNCLLKIVEKEK